MCELITFASLLRNAPKPDTSTEEFQSNPFSVHRFLNQGSGHSYPSHLTSFSIMYGQCSCGLFVPRSVTDHDHEVEERRIRSLRARGWSAAKIERALRDHAAAVANKPHRTPGFASSVLRYLVSILDDARYLEFIVHTHRAGFNDEPFSVTGPVRLGKHDFASGQSTLDLDTRYVLASEAPRSNPGIQRTHSARC